MSLAFWGHYKTPRLPLVDEKDLVRVCKICTHKIYKENEKGKERYK